MIRVEQRASTVLYKFLVSNCKGWHFLLPANVCSVIPLTFLAAGVDFSFVDIDETTHAGSFSRFKNALGKYVGREVGILFVNAYGYHNDAKQFYKNLRSINNDIIIIEDDCLCVPETDRTEPIEDVDLEFYSTGNSKYVQMPMEGGYGMMRNGFAYNHIKAPYNENGYSEHLKRIKACRKSGELYRYVENNWLPLGSFISDHYSESDYFHETERKKSFYKS